MARRVLERVAEKLDERAGAAAGDSWGAAEVQETQEVGLGITSKEWRHFSLMMAVAAAGFVVGGYIGYIIDPGSPVEGVVGGGLFGAILGIMCLMD